MSFLRHQFAIALDAVQPITRSTMITTLPSSLANSARSYMSSMVAAVTFR
jgi:hypothetical protein